VPKPGFKSYALKDELFDKLQKKFEQQKKELKLKGITSFSAYLTYLMNIEIEKLEFVRRKKLFFEKVMLDSTTLVIKDNIEKRVVKIKIKNKSLFCELDKKTNCMHVGFAYSLPEIYDLLNRK